MSRANPYVTEQVREMFRGGNQPELVEANNYYDPQDVSRTARPAFMRRTQQSYTPEWLQRQLQGVRLASGMLGQGLATQDQQDAHQSQRRMLSMIADERRHLAADDPRQADYRRRVASVLFEGNHHDDRTAGGLRDVPEQAARGVMRGILGAGRQVFEGTTGMLAQGAENLIGPNMVTDSVRDIGEAVGGVYAAGQQGYTRDPDADYFTPAGIAGGLAETGTRFGAQVGAGAVGTALGGPAGGTAAFMATTGADAATSEYVGTKDELIARGWDETEARNQALSEGLFEGAVVTATEALPGAAIFGRARRGVQSATALGRGARLAGNAAIAGGAETAQEFMQLGASDLYQLATRGESDLANMSKEELGRLAGRTALESAVLGGGARLAMEGPGAAQEMNLLARANSDRRVAERAFDESVDPVAQAFAGMAMDPINAQKRLAQGPLAPQGPTYDNPATPFQHQVADAERLRQQYPDLPAPDARNQRRAENRETVLLRAQTRPYRQEQQQTERAARLADTQGRIQGRLADRQAIIDRQVQADTPPQPDIQVGEIQAYSSQEAAQRRADWVNQRGDQETRTRATVRPVQMLGENVGWEVREVTTRTMDERVRLAPESAPRIDQQAAPGPEPVVRLADAGRAAPNPDGGIQAGQQPGDTVDSLDADPAGGGRPSQDAVRPRPNRQAPDNSRRNTYSKRGIEQRLVDLTSDLETDTTQEMDNEDLGDRVQVAFAGDLPTELKEALEGRDIRLRRAFRRNAGPNANMAQDQLDSLGVDRYLELVEGLVQQNSPTQRADRAKGLLREGPSAEGRFLAWMHDNLPEKQAERPKFDIVQVDDLPRDKLTSILGQDMAIIEEEGGLILTDGTNLIYLSDITDLPIDRRPDQFRELPDDWLEQDPEVDPITGRPVEGDAFTTPPEPSGGRDLLGNPISQPVTGRQRELVMETESELDREEERRRASAEPDVDGQQMLGEEVPDFMADIKADAEAIAKADAADQDAVRGPQLEAIEKFEKGTDNDPESRENRMARHGMRERQRDYVRAKAQATIDEVAETSPQWAKMLDAVLKPITQREQQGPVLIVDVLGDTRYKQLQSLVIQATHPEYTSEKLPPMFDTRDTGSATLIDTPLGTFRFGIGRGAEPKGATFAWMPDESTRARIEADRWLTRRDADKDEGGHPIPFAIAEAAHRNTSHTPEQRGRQEQARYDEMVREFKKDLARHPNLTKAQKAIMQEQVDRYADRLAQLYVEYLRARSRVASPMITGPARFPVERNRKASNAADRKHQAVLDLRIKARRAAERAIANGLTNDEQAAARRQEIEGYATEVVTIAARHKRGQAESFSLNNAKNRAFDRATRMAQKGDAEGVRTFLVALEREQAQQEAQAFTKRHRIWQLEAKAAARAGAFTPRPDRAPTYRLSDDLAVEWNAADERVKLLFADKPSEEVRTWLRSRGFRWSPKNKAWQRKNTPNVVYDLASKFGMDHHGPMRREFGLDPRESGGDEANPGSVTIAKMPAASAADLAPVAGSRVAPIEAGGSRRVSVDGTPESKTERTPIKAILGKKPRATRDIIADVYDSTNVPVRQTRLPRGIGGYYMAQTGGVTIRFRGDLDVAAHELGHALDDQYGLVKEFQAPPEMQTQEDDDSSSPFDAELIGSADGMAPFAIYGSWDPTDPGRQGSMSYARTEGVAEFMRALIVNPEVARERAPKFAARYDAKVPDAVKKQIEKFSDEFREFTGASPLERIKSHIRMYDDTRVEKLQKVFESRRGKRWRPSFMSRLDQRFGDSNAVLWEGIDYAMEAHGMASILPSRDPTVLIPEFIGGTATKLTDIAANGMVNHLDQRVTEGGYDWIREPITLTEADRKAGRTQEDMDRETNAVMIAQRIAGKFQLLEQRAQEEMDKLVGSIPDMLQEIKENPRGKIAARWRDPKRFKEGRDLTDAEVERAEGRMRKFAEKRYNRRIKVARRSLAFSIGAGGRVFNDLDSAESALAEFAQKPRELQDRVLESARRYRRFSDAVLEYAYAKGRIDNETLNKIREENIDWVSMMRHSDLERVTKAGGQKFASLLKSAEPRSFKRWKGSEKQPYNAWDSLMVSMAEIVTEVDRNQASRALFDLFMGKRHMHGEGDPKPFAHIIEPILDRKPSPGSFEVYRDGQPEHFTVKDENVRDALNGWDEYSGNDFASNMLGWLAKVIHTSVVHTPGFLTRNTIRDPFHRKLVTRTNSKIRNQLYMFTDPKNAYKDLEELTLAGGGFFGFWRGGRQEFTKRALKARQMADDGRSIFTTFPHLVTRLSQPVAWYSKMAQKSELLGRVAEYKDAKAYARKNHPEWSDYDVRKYAAKQSRDVVDYAAVGTWIKGFRRYIPFLNAGIQGLRRSIKGVKEDPGQFTQRWLTYIVAPTAFVYALNMMTGTDEERQQLPPYLKDFFWNIKIGPDLWLRIPKPFEAGVMASGLERSMDRARGNENAFDGYAGSFGRATIPVDESTIFLGFEPIVEAMMANHSFFRDQAIVPWWEEHKLVELRDGADKASRVGRFMQDLVGVDGRRIDHLITGYTSDLGRGALAASDIGRSDKPPTWREMIRQTGLLTSSPAWSSADVRFVLEWTAKYDQRKVAEPLINLGRMYSRATDTQERDQLARRMREMAAKIRPALERQSERLGDRAGTIQDRRRQLRDRHGR